MRPLRDSINVTLDGCCDHRAGSTDEDLHRYWAENLARADALIFGRVTYEMMEAAWRPPAKGVWPDWMADWMKPFAQTIHAAKKYVVSSTLDRVDWNAEFLRGDLGKAVQSLKEKSGKGIGVPAHGENQTRPVTSLPDRPDAIAQGTPRSALAAQGVTTNQIEPPKVLIRSTAESDPDTFETAFPVYSGYRTRQWFHFGSGLVFICFLWSVENR